MNIYSLALFAHVAGALGLAVALGFEWVERGALARRIGGPSLGILLPGLYMTATVWGGVPWIGLELLSFVAIVVGVAFLMTTKPDGTGALLAMAAALVAGVAWAFSARPARQIHELSTPAVQR
jgi:uncharacterized membrane protein